MNWLTKISQNPEQLIRTVNSTNIDSVAAQLGMMGGNANCDIIFNLASQNPAKADVLNDLAGRLGCSDVAANNMYNQSVNMENQALADPQNQPTQENIV